MSFNPVITRDGDAPPAGLLLLAVPARAVSGVAVLPGVRGGGDGGEVAVDVRVVEDFVDL